MAEKKMSEQLKDLNAAVTQLQQGDFQVRQAFGQFNENLQAVISLLGEESVAAEIGRLRQERQDKQEGEMAAGITALVAEKVLVPVAEVGAETLVIGTDTGPDGRTRRVQFETRAIPPEMLPQFIGKKPGESVTNNGVTLTVTEVYTVDKAAAAAFQQKQQAAANPQPEPVVTEETVAAVDAEVAQKAIDESGEPTTQA